MKNKAKSVLSLSLAGCLLCSSLAMAKRQQQGGFREMRPSEMENVEIISVKQAKGLKDDSFVVLQGYIDKSLGGEKYMFRDASGTIKLDIDDNKFRGLVVYPDDFVQISGQVDKGWFKTTEIDVKNITKKDSNQKNME